MLSEELHTKSTGMYEFPPQDCRNYNRSNLSIACSAVSAASIVASLNCSIFRCHRRLIRFFSKLVLLGVSSPVNRCSNGFKVFASPESGLGLELTSLNLSIAPQEISYEKTDSSSQDPPRKKKTIFLDLDETLVHSTMQPPTVSADFIVRPKIKGEVMTLFVVKRPGVDEFLERISEKYEVVVFTAGLREYATLVIDKLDKKKGMISQRFYRDSCKEIRGKFVKDLSMTGMEMKNVAIVDDNPNSYYLQPENGVPIKPFVDDLKDGELKKYAEFFDGCVEVEDMRVGIKEFIEQSGRKQNQEQ